MPGRRAKALDHLRQARESDPLSLNLLAIESSALAASGRQAEAQERLQRVFDIEADFWVAHLVQAELHTAAGRPDAAIESLLQADRLADGSSQAAASLGNMLARQGQRERAQQIIQRLSAQGTSCYVPPTSTGLIYAGLGDKEAAMASLQRGLAVRDLRDVRMLQVKNDSRWALLRDDARYAAVLRQMNLA